MHRSCTWWSLTITLMYLHDSNTFVQPKCLIMVEWLQVDFLHSTATYFIHHSSSKNVLFCQGQFVVVVQKINWLNRNSWMFIKSLLVVYMEIWYHLSLFMCGFLNIWSHFMWFIVISKINVGRRYLAPYIAVMDNNVTTTNMIHYIQYMDQSGFVLTWIPGYTQA